MTNNKSLILNFNKNICNKLLYNKLSKLAFIKKSCFFTQNKDCVQLTTSKKLKSRYTK